MEPAPQQYPYRRPAPRTRTGLVVLIAVITEIVLIGGGANQWVTKRIVEHASGTDRRLIDSAWLTYTWRFSSQHGEDAVWGSQLLLILTVLVVSALLVWVLVRGPVSFWRAFFGTWLAVIVASLLGGLVRGLVYPHTEDLLPGTNRVLRAVFSGAGPSNFVVAGSFALGLVVALITALIAATTGRREPVPAPETPAEFADYGPPPPTEPPPYLPPWQDSHYGPQPQPAGAEATTRLPTMASDEGDRTTQLPRAPEGGWAAPPPDTQLQREATPPPEDLPAGPEATQAHPAAAPEPEPEPERQPEPRPEPQAERQPGVVEQHTQAYPTVAEEQPASAEPQRREEPATEATAQFPRPPDDDELGHIEH